MVLAAFAAIYVIWGSTYLAIKLAIDTLPPLLMAGTRFVVAGAALWLLAPGNRNVRPTKADWRWAFILGAFLLLGGNGFVSIVEAKMPSGVAALLVTTVPLWMVLLDWLRPGGQRPTGLLVVGLALGFSGVVLLAGNDAGWAGGQVDYLYVAGILVGTLCWAIGSLLSRGSPIKLPILRSVALQMMAGGILLTAVGLLRGEWSDFQLDDVSWTSFWAWMFLIVFGSVIAFSAYSWLLTVKPAALVSTYAFVNPVVAVLLGAVWLSEPLGLRVLLASAIIVAAVALVTYVKARTTPERPVIPRTSVPGR
jgi:drug/metabolite transporter (DMT)-like permease